MTEKEEEKGKKEGFNWERRGERDGRKIREVDMEEEFDRKGEKKREKCIAGFN